MLVSTYIFSSFPSFFNEYSASVLLTISSSFNTFNHFNLNLSNFFSPAGFHYKKLVYCWNILSNILRISIYLNTSRLPINVKVKWVFPSKNETAQKCRLPLFNFSTINDSIAFLYICRSCLIHSLFIVFVMIYILSLLNSFKISWFNLFLRLFSLNFTAPNIVFNILVALKFFLSFFSSRHSRCIHHYW